MEETKVLHKKKVIAPKLRFNGFNDAWVDTRLKDLTSLITKGTTPQSFSNNGINYVKIEGLNGVNINKEKCLYIDEQTHNKELRRSILHNNDLLFAIAGATIGKVAIVTEDILPANTNQALAIIRLKDTKNLKYVLQILQSRIMKKYIQESISVGAQPNLNLEQMGDFKFHMPSLPEQEKIASFLSAVDEKIQLLNRKKQLLEQYKKGVMQQLFSGKLRFKDENGKTYPKWGEKKLGEIAEKKSSNIAANAIAENTGEYKIYGATGFLKTVDFYKEEEPYISIVKDGAGVGRTLLCDAKTSVLGTLDIIKPNPDVDLYFLYSVLNNIDFVKYTKGSTIPHIYFKDYSTENINIPCIEEQKKIADFLSAIDVKIESLSNQIIQTQNFKKGLLQQMFV